MARETPPAGVARIEPWHHFGSLIVQRDAAIHRQGAGGPPRDFMGLYIADEEVDQLLSELPGLDGPAADAVQQLLDRFEPAIAEARKALHGEVEHPTTMFGAVCWNVGVTGTSVEVLAVIAAVESDPRLQRLVGYIQDSVSAVRPTLWTIYRLFDGDRSAPRAVAPDAPLSRACLVELDGDVPWGARGAGLAPAFAWALIGDVSLDPNLPAGTSILHGPEPSGDGAGFVVISGGDRTTRRLEAMRRMPGSTFLVAPLPTTADGWRAVIREGTIAGVGVIVETGPISALPVEAGYWVERATHLTWALLSEREITLESLPERPWVDVQIDDGAADAGDWQAALGMDPVSGHDLDRDQLRLAAKAYPAVGDDLVGAVRRLASGHLDRLALRIRPKRTWDDLILPAEQLTQLNELTARYRHKALVYGDWGYRPMPSSGIVALFSGPSGTGKTLTAEIMANDLGLDVYKVDLSSVVSKYIGETEKNLEAIFNAASAGNLVLFFDEADSLFGKRSEVQDAHDRYANIEVSYLLQALERYNGFVILATNFAKNIDQAFMRRIHGAVEFPVPEEDERRAIWELSFPKAAPTTDLDIGFLARQFEIAGGSIRNAALHAAFMAADADEPITMRAVMIGLKREYQKLGRLRTEEDFDEYFHLVKGEA